MIINLEMDNLVLKHHQYCSSKLTNEDDNKLSCSCPLRLNESSPVTTKHFINSKNNNNNNNNNRRLNELSNCDMNGNMILRNNKKENLLLRNNNNNNNNNNNLVKNNILIKSKKRRFRSSLLLLSKLNYHNSRITINNNNNKHNYHLLKNNLILLPFIIILVSSLLSFIKADNNFNYANTPNYPSPLAASSLISQQHSNHPLVTINTNGPSLCPLVTVCQCKWSNGKQGASCDHRNLKTIPSQLPQDIQVLDMNGNPLIKLDRHIFQDKLLTNLQKIHLSDCKLSFIHPEAFAHLTNLVELDLSHNSILNVPIRSFSPLNHSLRKLNLAFNPIQTIESESFNSLSHLTTLDLSNCQLKELKAGSFNGLNELKELKLHDNKLTQLPMNVIVDLKQVLLIELTGNLWNCDCELKQSIDYLIKNHIQQTIQPTCFTPKKHKDIRWNIVKQEEFICPPIVLNNNNFNNNNNNKQQQQQQEKIVGAGSNISLECTARGSQPLTFVWFQDEKNLTTSKPNSTDLPSSTKLLEEKRYEIAEETGIPSSLALNGYYGGNVTTSILYLFNLKLTDSSIFLCWVENAAGYTMANFSLIVNDSPPTKLDGQLLLPGDGNSDGSNWPSIFRLIGFSSTTSSSNDGQMGFVSLIFVIALVCGCLILLLIFKQNAIDFLTFGNFNRSSNSSDRSTKSSYLSGSKNNNNTNDIIKKNSSSLNHLSSSNKFSQAPHQIRLAEHELDDDDDDVDTDDSCSSEQDADSSGSQSSCRKKNHVNNHNHHHHQVISSGDLDGFIEHMRSGIINMDYHSMSPVIQFNKNNNNNNNNININNTKQNKLQSKAPFLDTNMANNNATINANNHLFQHQHAMHHFPSESNTSSLPSYNQYHNGSASMTTTTSDLSPSSSSSAATATSATINNQHQQQLHLQHQLQLQQQQQQQIQIINNPLAVDSLTTNCDLVQQHLNNHLRYHHHHHQQQQHHHHVSPSESSNQLGQPATSISYTSDYQSNYGEPHEQQLQMSTALNNNNRGSAIFYDNNNIPTTSHNGPVPDLYHAATIAAAAASAGGFSSGNNTIVQANVLRPLSMNLAHSSGGIINGTSNDEQQYITEYINQQQRNNQQLQRGLNPDGFHIL